MTSPGKAKGDRAELEVQDMLRDRLGLPNVRRALGAGRKDDVGDIDGVPNTCIQVTHRANIAAAIAEKLPESERQRRNRRVRLAATFVRRSRVRTGDPWVVCLTVPQWCRMWHYAQLGIQAERASTEASQVGQTVARDRGRTPADKDRRRIRHR